MSATLPTIYGVKIYLKDFQQPVTANATLGLFNRIATLSNPLAVYGNMLKTFNVSPFEINDPIQIYGGPTLQETNIITAISPTMNAVFLLYTAANLYPANSTQVQANSVFRLCQNDIVNPTETWKSGMLMQNGIGNFSRKIELRRMGNIAVPGKCTVQINNTAQFYKEMKNRGVYFNGLVAKIIKFTGNIQTARWVGECQKPTWNPKRYMIPINGGLYNKRISNVTTLINNDPITGNFPLASNDKNGKVIPFTIGQFNMPLVPGSSLYQVPQCAKFQRISEAETPLLNAPISGQYYPPTQSFIIPAATITPAGLSVFPITVTGITPATLFSCKIGLTDTQISLPNITGSWCKIIAGGDVNNNSLVGKYRMVTGATYNYGTCTLNFYISAPFETDPCGDPTATTYPNQCWVSFVQLNYQFYGDMWPLFGLFSKLNQQLTNQVQLYMYNSANDSKNYLRVPVWDARMNPTTGTGGNVVVNQQKQIGYVPIAIYGYTLIQGLLNNIIQLNPLMCDGNPNILISFDIFPFKDKIANPYTLASDLMLWIPSTNNYKLNFNVYSTNGSISAPTPVENVIGSVNPLQDQSDSSYDQWVYSINFNGVTGITAWIAFEFQIDMTQEIGPG